VVNAVAAVLSELKDRYHPRRAILVGHSGGAAIVGDLLGQQGTAVDGALLVSCLCDLAAWRKHMQSVKGGAIWERPVRSLSPLALVDGVAASAKVWLLVGSEDQITPSTLTLAYAEALRNRNIAVQVTIAPGLGHRILLELVAMERLQEVASTIDAGRYWTASGTHAKCGDLRYASAIACRAAASMRSGQRNEPFLE
jgi:alpha-beta hydrolase superfamily lysophospholipase